MKIAVITDVHGNTHALDAVLEDIGREKPDVVVGAGDMMMAGSAGLPLRGKVEKVDYLLLTYEKQDWHFAYKTVKFDHAAAAAESAASNFLSEAGPVGWLMFDEILTQQDRLVPFLREYCPSEKPADSKGFYETC